MKWIDLLRQLDVVRADLIEGRLKALEKDTLVELGKMRSQLRAQHGANLNMDDVTDTDPLAIEIREAIKPYYKEPEPQKPILDDLFATLPQEEVPAHRIQDVVYRGDGEGRMVVMKRETPLILREPDIVEVTEEELSK